MESSSRCRGTACTCKARSARGSSTRTTTSRARGTVGSTTRGPARTTSTSRFRRRHTRCGSRTERSRSVSTDLERGLELARQGEYFEAHEALEDAWRASEPEEKDFFQGLVHVVVAWYQAGRGNRVGFERQLEKAERRLGPFAPTHRAVDVDNFLRQVRAAREAGSLDPPPLDVR